MAAAEGAARQVLDSLTLLLLIALLHTVLLLMVLAHIVRLLTVVRHMVTVIMERLLSIPRDTVVTVLAGTMIDSGTGAGTRESPGKTAVPANGLILPKRTGKTAGRT